MLLPVLRILQHINAPSILCSFALFVHSVVGFSQSVENHIRKKAEINGSISPKSINWNGNNLFAAQNMMYRHTITFYNKQGELQKKLKDEVRLSDYGIDTYGNGLVKGAPVESVFTNNGEYLWVSNYHMSGKSFTNEGCDYCIGTTYDPSFLYKINTTTFAIENVVEVGAVPKFIAVSKDEKLLLVSNWVSSDVSVIDLTLEKEIQRVTVGKHPRGIAITADNKQAYVTIMGSTKIAVVNLETYAVDYILGVGKAPRSIILADHDSTLYVSLNSSQAVLKYNVFTAEKTIVKTPSGPRSMVITPAEDYLYVVNYFDDSFSKISTDSMQLEATVATNAKPIGICGNWDDAELWVACYSGSIELFKDFSLEKKQQSPNWLMETLNLADFSLPHLPYQDTLTDTSSTPLDTPLVFTAQNHHKDTLQQTAEPIAEQLPFVLPKTSTQQRWPLTKRPQENCTYYIIIGAFSVPENAQNKHQELLEKGFNSTLLNGKNLTYVTADCAATKKSAEQKKQTIKTTLAGAESAWILAQ